MLRGNLKHTVFLLITDLLHIYILQLIEIHSTHINQNQIHYFKYLLIFINVIIY